MAAPVSNIPANSWGRGKAPSGWVLSCPGGLLLSVNLNVLHLAVITIAFLDKILENTKCEDGLQGYQLKSYWSEGWGCAFGSTCCYCFVILFSGNLNSQCHWATDKHRGVSTPCAQRMSIDNLTRRDGGPALSCCYHLFVCLFVFHLIVLIEAVGMLLQIFTSCHPPWTTLLSWGLQLWSGSDQWQSPLGNGPPGFGLVSCGKSK